MSAVAELENEEARAIAKVGDEGHGDLSLSIEESAQEAAEAAANRERELGGVPDAVQDAYDRAYQQVLADAEFAKARELEGEAGEVVGEMPPAEAESSDVPPEKIKVGGTVEKGPKADGKQPGEVFLAVKGVKIEVPEGSFKKGERLRFEGELVLFKTQDLDKLDASTKTAVECARTFGGEIIDFMLVGEAGE